jgi:hypothetical protein
LSFRKLNNKKFCPGAVFFAKTLCVLCGKKTEPQRAQRIRKGRREQKKMKINKLLKSVANVSLGLRESNNELSSVALANIEALTEESSNDCITNCIAGGCGSTWIMEYEILYQQKPPPKSMLVAIIAVIRYIYIYGKMF